MTAQGVCFWHQVKASSPLRACWTLYPSPRQERAQKQAAVGIIIDDQDGFFTKTLLIAGMWDIWDHAGLFGLGLVFNV